MKKLAIIRGEDVASCPYGLEIPNACSTVGEAISEMTALPLLDDEKQIGKTKQNNIKLFVENQTGNKCPFADKIMPKFNKVDCLWPSNEASGYLPASPLYPSSFIGHGISPSYTDRSVPVYDPRLTYLGQDVEFDVPFGMFSIFANRSNENRLLKIAEKYTNKFNNVREKVSILRNKYLEAFKLVISSAPAQLTDEQLEKLLFVIEDWTK